MPHDGSDFPRPDLFSLVRSPGRRSGGLAATFRGRGYRRGRLGGPSRRILGSRRLLGRLRHHGNRFDLQQRFRTREGRNHDGGAGRWRRGIKEAHADLAENREMRDVDKIIVELDHVLETGPDGSERVFQVDKNLLGLGPEISGWADDLIVDTKAELAGNVDDAPRCPGFDDVAKSARP